jgi:acetyltransferase-like isoleucine patch superfamily enzyme
MSFLSHFIKNKLRLLLFKKKWRKLNNHNFTTVSNLFDTKIVSVGKMTYGSIHALSYNAANEKLIIGSHVSIANGVKFILGGNHKYNSFSTYPFKVKLGVANDEAYSNGSIIIEDDVWIGMDAIILSGIRIGRGSVIAAGSVVTRDVPEYCIFGGNPAKKIKCRFNSDIIDKLKSINYDDLNYENIINNINLLYEDINNDNIENILRILNDK